AGLTGDAHLDLPIRAPFLGINGTVPTADNTIVISIPDFTDFDTATVFVPDAIKNIGNFNNIDAASLVSLIGQVSGWLDQFRHGDSFSKFNIPLIGPALDKVLDLNS